MLAEVGGGRREPVEQRPGYEDISPQRVGFGWAFGGEKLSFDRLGCGPMRDGARGDQQRLVPDAPLQPVVKPVAHLGNIPGPLRHSYGKRRGPQCARFGTSVGSLWS